jgi:hypothetical protein
MVVPMAGTRTPISQVRLAIAAAITAVPAYGTPPDDVAHLPCAVVGPPTMTRTTSMAGMWSLEYPVIVVGRAYDFDEVHTELDDVAWAVIEDLERAQALGISVDSVEPGTVIVGGHEQPSHTLTVVATVTYCT